MRAQVSSQPKIEEVKPAWAKDKPHRLIGTPLLVLTHFQGQASSYTKIMEPSVEETTTGSPTLLAECSYETNKIGIVDLNTICCKILRE